ncbi:dephospho-CoA kinase [Streptococcus oricebi]|uniref:Dephospho-CoA kinase n=1 Tax=Streptococcus oricebi TaxID=1547447 RepID=A0ABS5B2A3_9STRE|nr:dephospho-CoA kinase [Streptococcus oricebi]MBP2622895.1 dephospho-CoA kinase [Streptococcus oricebi]
MGKIIGLTGGIASGKSSVSQFLREEGYQVIDADQVVHDLQAPQGALYQVLLAEFGPEILQEDGQLNRQKLGQMLFDNPDLMKKSSQLQNGIIREELARLRDRLKEKETLFFMDIPLLFELDYESWFDQIWLVDVEDKVQLERLKARDGLSDSQARQRLKAQLPLAQKRQRAHVLLDNNGSLRACLNQVEGLLAKERR